MHCEFAIKISGEYYEAREPCRAEVWMLVCGCVIMCWHCPRCGGIIKKTIGHPSLKCIPRNVGDSDIDNITFYKKNGANTMCAMCLKTWKTGLFHLLSIKLIAKSSNNQTGISSLYAGLSFLVRMVTSVWQLITQIWLWITIFLVSFTKLSNVTVSCLTLSHSGH